MPSLRPRTLLRACALPVAVLLLASPSAHGRVRSGDVGPDRLAGTPAADTLKGGGGPDRLWGGPGLDCLFGDTGADWLWGQAGNDVLDAIRRGRV
jgi:RTX calcium-binding nonapeptide repeat (4 copies)